MADREGGGENSANIGKLERWAGRLLDSTSNAAFQIDATEDFPQRKDGTITRPPSRTGNKSPLAKAMDLSGDGRTSL